MIKYKYVSAFPIRLQDGDIKVFVDLCRHMKIHYLKIWGKNSSCLSPIGQLKIWIHNSLNKLLWKPLFPLPMLDFAFCRRWVGKEKVLEKTNKVLHSSVASWDDVHTSGCLKISIQGFQLFRLHRVNYYNKPVPCVSWFQYDFFLNPLTFVIFVSY